MSASILTCGAGPVGMVLALKLARYGVAVRIIDKSAARTDKSKAQCGAGHSNLRRSARHQLFGTRRSLGLTGSDLVMLLVTLALSTSLSPAVGHRSCREPYTWCCSLRTHS
jgi:hypothetical protein